MRPGSERRPEAGADREAEVLGLLGLARRAGAVAAGTEAARRAVQAGEAHLVLLAGDASPTQLKKIVGPAGRAGVIRRTIADRDRLGAALGGPPLSAVAVTNAGFAEQVLRRVPGAPDEG